MDAEARKKEARLIRELLSSYKLLALREQLVAHGVFTIFQQKVNTPALAALRASRGGLPPGNPLVEASILDRERYRALDAYEASL